MSEFKARQFRDIFDVVALVRSAVDPASLADAAGGTVDVTVTGAAIGDFVLFAPGVDMVDMIVTAYVVAANTVQIRVQNESGAAANIASSTWNFAVLRPAAHNVVAAS